MENHTLESYFARLPENRRAKSLRYPLAKVLTVMVVGMLCNAHGYRELDRFMKANIDDLKRYFGWTRNATPSYEALRRVVNRLDFAQVSQVFMDWVNAQVQWQENDWVALDGKAIRSTLVEANGEAQNFVSLVSAFSHRLGVTVALWHCKRLKTEKTTKAAWYETWSAY